MNDNQSFEQIRVAAGSLNQTPYDLTGNSDRIKELLSKARKSGVSIICLPELAVSGYGCEDRFLDHSFIKEVLETAKLLINHTTGLACNLGIPILIEDRLYNGVLIAVNGKATGIVLKKYLCNDGVHYEQRWFHPWPIGKVTSIDWYGDKLPVGDLVFNLNGINLGFEICHDAWVEQRHAIDLKKRGVTIICNPSASHFAKKKHFKVRSLVSEGSKNGVYIFANLLGCESGRTIYGGDRILAIDGKIIKSGKRFTYTDNELTSIDIEKLTLTPYCGDPNLLVKVHLSLPKTILSEDEKLCQLIKTDQDTISKADLERIEFEEFSRATSLGLFDYLRKSYSNGFAVSLSGGADSASICVLVQLMFKLLLSDLSLDEAEKKLSYIPDIKQKLSLFKEGSDLKSILITAYQKTCNSSLITQEAAQKIALACGAKFAVIDLDPQFQAYRSICEESLGRSLTWEKDSITLQNIQARVRSPSIWAIANTVGALLLTTSNRSELAVGYATMDGDTSGGLAPIAGVDKSFIRRWLTWMESTGLQEQGPIPQLSFINCQAPTAELLPPEKHQTDEGDLMPYDILNFIERSFVYERLPRTKIISNLQLSFPNFAQDAEKFVEKFFKLWRSSQWKRERSAPSFHLDEYSLDPKSWCRYPILSGK